MNGGLIIPQRNFLDTLQDSGFRKEWLRDSFTHFTDILLYNVGNCHEIATKRTKPVRLR